MASKKTTLRAFAKINLTLNVFGVRPDGFHELDSLIAPISLHDVLTFEESEFTELKISGSSVDIGKIGKPEDNLILRTVLAVEKFTGKSLPVLVSVDKNIPIGGGLGGGSADAAATLHGLNSLFSLGLSEPELLSIAASLGSDIPALVLGGYVRMTGRGECVQRVFPKFKEPLHVVLLNPGIHCPTNEIYKSYDLCLTKRTVFCDNTNLILNEGRTCDIGQYLHNDLEATVFQLHSQVRAAAEMLKAAGCQTVMLSGSGGTCFGLVANTFEGNEVLNRLADCGTWHSLASDICLMV